MIGAQTLNARGWEAGQNRSVRDRRLIQKAAALVQAATVQGRRRVSFDSTQVAARDNAEHALDVEVSDLARTFAFAWGFLIESPYRIWTAVATGAVNA